MGQELQPGLPPEGGGGSRATGRRQDVDCMAIALIPQVRADLQRLQDRTNLSRTDITNRAITLYEFVEAQLSAGRELLIRDEDTGEILRVLIT